MASRNLEVRGDFGHISYICMYAYSIYIILPIYVIQYLICICNIGIEKGERKHHRAFNFLGGCISDKRQGCVRDSNIDQIPRSIVERVALRKGPLRFSFDSKG